MQSIDDRMREILGAYAENGKKYNELASRITLLLAELEQLNALKDEVINELHEIRDRENKMFLDMAAEGVDVEKLKSNIMEFVNKLK